MYGSSASEEDDPYPAEASMRYPKVSNKEEEEK